MLLPPITRAFCFSSQLLQLFLELPSFRPYVLFGETDEYFRTDQYFQTDEYRPYLVHVKFLGFMYYYSYFTGARAPQINKIK